MQTSGLILDVYDDVNGDVLRTMFPDRGSIPGFVKQASSLDPDTRSRLPDDVFALVLINDGEKLRKYACVDEGNTALSVTYFVKNAHKLPVEARVRTAENLKVACGWYGLDVPEELEKEASLLQGMAQRIAKKPVQSAMTAMTAVPLYKGTKQSIRTGVNQAVGTQHAINASRYGKFASAKEAELAGTTDMPHSVDTKQKPLPAKTTIKKTAHMNPYVHVTAKEASAPQYTTRQGKYALWGEYPINDYKQVKTAASYFEEYGHMFQPEERREYCVNLVKQASAFGVPMPDSVRKYGSDGYAPLAEREMALDTRRLKVAHDRSALDILDKIASASTTVPPGDYLALLSEFDRSEGLHTKYDRGGVMDPYFSTYGFEKSASEESFRDEPGGRLVTGEGLRALCSDREWLKGTFGDDFVSEYFSDPVGIYKSMPVEQKQLLADRAAKLAG